MVFLIIIVVISLITSQVVIRTNTASMETSYKKLRTALGEELEMYKTFSKNTGNHSYYIKGTYKEHYKLKINNYFDASATTQSKTYIHLTPVELKSTPKFYLIPAKNRHNSSYGGTSFIDLYGSSDEFNKRFALATNDESYAQLLFTEDVLIESIMNTPILREGFLVLDGGDFQFTLQRKLKAEKDKIAIIDLLDFMIWFFEFSNQYKKD